ncbi:pyridoxal phosphate-dependent aminotransferase [Mangrovibacterium marinum]|uniref:Aminotransferase n=1 Tax=Mangrovibacterium marinum TaxID=1639118 RepID=A0A2T5C3H9_9BACT|nr:pyridoxal phosphate-dependent aminotransferase [Mangrovibacterium marinum]PTN09342.1 aspartate/methionine/tyrosine aminotransferase [Mangrovibacterium marinum]
MTASRAKEIKPFIVMEVLEKAQEMEKQGIDVIHLEVGEPDFDIPGCVKQAVATALDEGKTHYTHSLGDPELRQAIADHYLKEYAVRVAMDQIIVTSGSSPAILMALSVLCEQGDEVIISDPAYACYVNFIHYIGAKAVRVPVSSADGFQFHGEDIRDKITARTKAILINSPMNPTGNLLSKESLEMMASLDVPIVSDEIYHGLVYGEKARSILEFTDQAFVLNGFSKRYAMTGLRLGYLIAPKKYIRNLQKLQQNLFICASSTAQKGAIAALTKGGSAVEQMVRVYDERRRYLIARLRQLGFTIPVEPTGAFYVFVDARHLADDSYQLAFDILEKAHLGLTPGIDFGPGGEGYLRFSYANSLEHIQEGLNRLEQYLHNRKEQEQLSS